MTLRLALAGAALALLEACTGTPAQPVKQYELTGQVLAVYEARQELAIKHDDIEGYMPGMTMSFPVATKSLMAGRTPGELIKATLEVDGLVGRIVTITHVGSAPLPDTNTAAMTAGILAVGDQLPDAALIDQQDRRRSLSEWIGTPTVITFIYTRCPLPNFCPAMNRHFAALQKGLAADATLAGRVKLISITFDPEHDTPAVLADFAAKHDSDPAVWTWLTGDRVTTDRLAAKFGVGLIREADTPTEVIHNLRTTLVDGAGRVVKIYSGSDWTPAAVLADIRGVLAR
ncbi:MAG: SCO family protein [Acidobacteria bacterium]|nr:SCO family protein [Acidobacteriota bacterium]